MNSIRNAKKRANRRARKLIQNSNIKNDDNKQELKKTPQQALTHGCILHCEGFDYYYLGKKRKNPFAFSAEHLYGINVATLPDAYLKVQAVFIYKERYYFIPSSFSFIGTLSRMRKYQIISKPPSTPTYLDYAICQKVCPGFLD